ncbi:MAG: OB-fold domain-containing protein [Acidimicrobiia bacterium]|nr:OB-fold domain-containing protein [Acidimicrobiia bacterium]
MAKTEVPFRILPRVTDLNRFYWTAGRDGELRFQRCNACKYFMHPPSVLCPRCHSKDLGIEAVSGRGDVHTFSINYQPWMPGLEPPFVLAVVRFPEQEDLRVTTNIVNCAPEDVTFDMPVQVLFEAHVDDEVWIPLFEPSTNA